jgi:hypothetical protein
MWVEMIARRNSPHLGVDPKLPDMLENNKNFKYINDHFLKVRKQSI